MRQAQTLVSGQDCAHVHEGVPVLSLLKMCLCVQSFCFVDPELRQSRHDRTHVRTRVPVLCLLKMCLCVQSFCFADAELWQA